MTLRIFKGLAAIVLCFAIYKFYVGFTAPFNELSLIRNNYDVLDEDAEGWNIRFKEWQDNLSSSNKYTYRSAEDMKKKCNRLLKYEFGEETYKEAKSRCTKPNFKNKVLETSGIRLLTLREEEDQWKSKISEYNESDEKKNISILKNNKNSYVKNSDIDIYKLRIWCSNEEKKYYKKDSALDSAFEKYKLYCTTTK